MYVPRANPVNVSRASVPGRSREGWRNSTRASGAYDQRCDEWDAVSRAQRGWKAMRPMPTKATVTPAMSQEVGRTPSTHHSHTIATVM